VYSGHGTPAAVPALINRIFITTACFTRRILRKAMYI
jgi:hypothetical protein